MTEQGIMQTKFLIRSKEYTITAGYQKLFNFLIKRAREMHCRVMVAFIAPNFNEIYFLRRMGFTLKLDDPMLDLLLDSIIDIYKIGVSDFYFHDSPAFLDLIASKSVNFDGKRFVMYARV
jgi:hypothetical protein